MTGVGRIVLPEYLHHITEGGHDRIVVFIADRDYHYYLDTLAAYRQVFGVKLFPCTW